MISFFINPGKCFSVAEKSHTILRQATIYLMIFGLLYALVFSPNDYQQGFTVKIMYVHVPSAWLAMLAYALMTLYGIIAFVFKIPLGFIFIKATAPIGLVFTIICLITGSIWGKPMWGTWWVWDARLTSVLILSIFYIVIIILHKSFDNIEIGEKISTVFVLIGSVNLPIIKYSVEWWNTLHQPASVSKLSSPSIELSILLPLILMTIAFSFCFLYILSIRIRAEIELRKSHIEQ